MAISSRRASGSAQGLSSAANFHASRVIGVFTLRAWSAAELLVPGVQISGTQKSPASAMPKLRNSGTAPARIRLDLPEPEPPMTATNWVCRSLSMTSRTWRSRPNSSADSPSRKGRSPGYGTSGMRLRAASAADGMASFMASVRPAR
jgi:hypothetical protein